MEPQTHQAVQQEPQRPTREPPKTQTMLEEEAKMTIPHTPGRERPELSPRLRLNPKNFKSDLVQ
eukprot:4271369-Amphidinium_carterae.1